MSDKKSGMFERDVHQGDEANQMNKGQEFLVNMENRPLTNTTKKNSPKIIDSSELLISLTNPTDEFTVMLLRKQTTAPKRLPVTRMR